MDVNLTAAGTPDANTCHERTGTLAASTALQTSTVPTLITTTTTTSTTTMSSTTTTTTTAITTGMTTIATNATTSTKTLKRCLSVPIIKTLPLPDGRGAVPVCTTKMTTRSAAAAAGRMAANAASTSTDMNNMKLAKKHNNTMMTDNNINNYGQNVSAFGNNKPINVPRSNPCSREVSPAPMFNIFAPRARRYSASSYCPAGGAIAAAAGAAVTNAPLCLTPRVSQLRQEECADVNSREVNHEREVHSAMQMSQSWEDLTLVAENWSCKSDEFSNPLQVILPTGPSGCSSPSPTSNRAGLRLPYGLSPSPTRRTFATRRSMSPIAMRPSQLGPVKRKFELDDNNSSNWNVYSPPPLKKIFTESRGSSPVCQSPSSVCPSPDSGTYDGRITPKLFISKLCTTNNNGNGNGNGNNNGNSNSACSSPMSASPSSSNIGNGNSVGGDVGAIDSTATSTFCSSSSLPSSGASSISGSSSGGGGGGSEPMCIGNSIDEGISISEGDDKQQCISTSRNTIGSASSMPQPMSTDMQDDATLMDDMKSETSSIGGCSSISIESSSCDSGAKAAASFLNKLNVTEDGGVSTSFPSLSSPSISTVLGQKNFFINKQGVCGPKKFIVNHDNLPISSTTEPLLENNTVSSTTASRHGNASSAAVTANKSVGSVDMVTASGIIVENKL